MILPGLALGKVAWGNAACVLCNTAHREARGQYPVEAAGP